MIEYHVENGKHIVIAGDEKKVCDSVEEAMYYFEKLRREKNETAENAEG